MRSKINSDELIFFNLLKSLLAYNNQNNSDAFSLSLNDLQEKIEMDKQIISGIIDKLKNDGLISFDGYAENSDHLNLHFERTYKQIFELLPPADLDLILLDINKFIFENIHLFNFTFSNSTACKYAKKIKEKLDKNPNANINNFIREGINELYSQEIFIIKIFKILYNMSKNSNEENQQLVEKIIYCFFNLPIDENPFITTLFLTRISFELENLKLYQQKGATEAC